MPARKKKSERKDDVIRFRVTQAQRAVLAEAADRKHLELSAWIRAVALEEAGKVLGLDGMDHPDRDVSPRKV